MAIKAYPAWYLWRHYWNIFGTLPSNGTPHDADCVIVQAFGRNSVPDRELPKMSATLDKIRKAGRTVEMLSWLHTIGFDPGRPNRDMAQILYYHVRNHDLVIAAQWEIVYTLFERVDREWTKRAINSNRLFCLWPRPQKKFYRTHEVLDDALQFLPSHNFLHPLLIAHDLHLPRVYMLAARRWQNPVVGFETITRAFDHKSVQKHATSPSRWYPYEALGRIHHFFHRWV